MNRNGRKYRLLKALLWIVGIWAGILLILEIVFSPPLATKAVNSFADRYVEGKVTFGKASVSFFRHFPAVSLSLEDFSITDPEGNGERKDTLASFRKFSVSANVSPLLFGRIRIPEVELVRPRIFAYVDNDGKANWDIFSSGEQEAAPDSTATEDSSGISLPHIHIGKIRLTEHPHIVYSDRKDTVFAMVDIKEAGFDGRLRTGKRSRNRIGLKIDSMFVAGRIGADTLALGLDKLHIHEHHNHMDIHAKAKTMAATRSFGRMFIPVDLGGTLHFPKDSVPAVAVRNFRADIAAIPIEGEADLRFHTGSTAIDGNIFIKECKVNDIIHKFVRNFIPEAEGISTDAVISLEASCNDRYVYGSGGLPAFKARLTVPESDISYEGIPAVVRMSVDTEAECKDGRLGVNIRNAKVRTEGLDLKLSGSSADILASDPLLKVDGQLMAVLDSLVRFLPDTLDVTASGRLEASLSGSTRVSHISLYTFSQADLQGSLNSSGMIVKAPDDSLDVTIGAVEMNLGPENVTSRRDTTKSFRLIGVTGKIQKIDVSYKDAFSIDGESVAFSAKSSASEDPEDKRGRLGGRLSAHGLKLTDASGSSISLDETSNGFQMMPKRDNPNVPVLTLTSRNKRINLATDVNRAILTDASIYASAAMNSIERREKVRQLRDSLARVYPDVPEDSLFRHAMSRRQVQRQVVPDWMKEEDFRKQDIDIRLDQSLAKYFRDWDLNARADIRTGIVMTPYFPLRNILRGVRLTVTNDRVGIDSLKVMSGKSMIEAKGELTGLRQALAGRMQSRSLLKLKLDIGTDGMDANELLTAYNAGSNFNPDENRDKMAEASNSEFLQMVIADTAEVDEKIGLIVIPANLNADISVNGKSIRYTDLEISELQSRLLMKERCVQISNTLATSNMGDVSFEGFYATRSKKDIRAGFDFNLKDITAEKVIGLMPAVDTIMPLLKSFAGKLNCELAATASLDTNMNIITPSINGVMRISGDDLTISDSDLFTSLAKKLKFDNSKVGRIRHMMVEGVIKDNVIEVFPFVLKLDRYTLALSGKQNLDMSYRYHASLIRSPMLIKVGVDVYGPDFDNMKFKIGKPKYKNERVPVFSAVIDETKINLAESIKGIFEKGVEAAVKENERLEAIAEHKNEIGYVNAVDVETEELSEEEKKQLEAETEEPAADTEQETTENNSDNE